MLSWRSDIKPSAPIACPNRAAGPQIRGSRRRSTRASDCKHGSCLGPVHLGPVASGVAQVRSRTLGSILCVDDDQETARVLALALVCLGYDVELAADGEIGLAKITAKRPDLVLCDF